MKTLCLWSMLLGCSVTVLAVLGVTAVYAQSSGGTYTCGFQNPPCQTRAGDCPVTLPRCDKDATGKVCACH
jgi:hypothetical protein